MLYKQTSWWIILISTARHDEENDGNHHGNERNRVANGEADLLLYVDNHGVGEKTADTDEPVEPTSNGNAN